MVLSVQTEALSKLTTCHKLAIGSAHFRGSKVKCQVVDPRIALCRYRIISKSGSVTTKKWINFLKQNDHCIYW